MSALQKKRQERPDFLEHDPSCGIKNSEREADLEDMSKTNLESSEIYEKIIRSCLNHLRTHDDNFNYLTQKVA